MDSVALEGLALAQIEVKVTVSGDVVGVTLTTTLVVPYAESGFAPNVGAVIVAPATGADALMLKPINAVTGAVPTWAFAVTVVAPPAVAVAAFKPIDATPEELVSAVPVDGVSVATAVLAVLKVTTTLETGAPAASNTVAFTVAGVLVVGVRPVAWSKSAIVMLGTAVVVVVPPVVVVPGGVPPLPQPDRSVNKAANKNIAGNS